MALPKISFLGRMTRNPELSFSANGIAFCKVGLACSEKFGEKETTLFIDGTAFKKTAEMINNIQRGQRVFVSGKIQTDTWQDSQSGQNRSKTSMIIESFEFIEPKDQNQQQGQQQQNGFQNQQQSQNQPNAQQNWNASQQGNNSGFQNQGNQGFSEPQEDD